MRKQILWNSDWLFARGDTPEKATPVTLPHTWNAKDGQDGGNDYYRGTCLYTKAFAAPAHSDSEEVWLEFEGVAMTAVVTLNGQELARHEGGYATFRVNLTPALAAQNTLTVAVDNGKNRTVYPQKADFTSTAASTARCICWLCPRRTLRWTTTARPVCASPLC